MDELFQKVLLENNRQNKKVLDKEKSYADREAKIQETLKSLQLKYERVTQEKIASQQEEYFKREEALMASNDQTKHNLATKLNASFDSLVESKKADIIKKVTQL